MILRRKKCFSAKNVVSANLGKRSRKGFLLGISEKCTLYNSCKTIVIKLDKLVKPSVYSLMKGHKET